MFTAGDIDRVIETSEKYDGDLSFPDGNLSMHLELAPQIVEFAVAAKVLPSGMSATYDEYVHGVTFFHRPAGTRLILASRTVFEHELKVKGTPGRDGILKVLVAAQQMHTEMCEAFEEAKK